MGRRDDEEEGSRREEEDGEGPVGGVCPGFEGDSCESAGETRTTWTTSFVSEAMLQRGSTAAAGTKTSSARGGGEGDVARVVRRAVRCGVRRGRRVVVLWEARADCWACVVRRREVREERVWGSCCENEAGEGEVRVDV